MKGTLYIHNDGHHLKFDQVSAAVLAADAALATARFRETVTTRDGAVLHQRGAATWLWRLRSGEWTMTTDMSTTIRMRKARTEQLRYATAPAGSWQRAFGGRIERPSGSP